MTTELFALLLTMGLAASMWIPFVVGVNMQRLDMGAIFARPPDLSELPEWVHRAHRAHLNLMEQAVPFAVLVLVAHVLGVSTTITASGSTMFFVLRVIHAAGMVSGVLKFPLRPMVFSAGWICILLLIWQVIAHAPTI
jgi:uncharacterized MAPEG superfamily protein